MAVADYCPICGQWVHPSLSLVADGGPQHRCKQRTLEAMDRQRGEDRSDPILLPAYSGLKVGSALASDEFTERQTFRSVKL